MRAWKGRISFSCGDRLQCAGWELLRTSATGMLLQPQAPVVPPVISTRAAKKFLMFKEMYDNPAISQGRNGPRFGSFTSFS